MNSDDSSRPNLLSMNDFTPLPQTSLQFSSQEPKEQHLLEEELRKRLRVSGPETTLLLPYFGSSLCFVNTSCPHMEGGEGHQDKDGGWFSFVPYRALRRRK